MINKMNRIFVDFHNVDSDGRIRLNCTGTVQDLNRCGIPLKSGIKIMMYQEELEVPGEIVFSEEEKIWVAKLDWLKIIEEETKDK